MFRVVPSHEDWAGVDRNRNSLRLAGIKKGPCPISGVITASNGVFKPVRILFRERAQVRLYSNLPLKRSWSVTFYRHFRKTEGEGVNRWGIFDKKILARGSRIDEKILAIPGEIHVGLVAIEKAKNPGSNIDFRYCLFGFHWTLGAGEEKSIDLASLRAGYSLKLIERRPDFTDKRKPFGAGNRVLLVKNLSLPTPKGARSIPWGLNYLPGSNLELCTPFKKMKLQWISGLRHTLLVNVLRKNIYYLSEDGWR